MLRLVAPSGTPISLGRITASVLSTRVDAVARFEQMFAQRLGVKHVWAVSSARAGLTLMLQSMAESASSKRDEVIIPAYTCYSVAAAVARAGLKIRPIDIEPATLDYDYRQLGEIDLRRVLAIIPCSLFGLVADWSRLKKCQTDRFPYLIDDAAQALGSNYEDTPCGSLGDGGLISLDRGKNLTTFSGGVILTNNDELAVRLTQRLKGTEEPSTIVNLVCAVKTMVYAVLLRPGLFRLPASLPFLNLGETVYDELFPIERLGRFQATLGCRMLPDLDILNGIRSDNGDQIRESLGADHRYTIPKRSEGKAIFLRLPVYAPSKIVRDRAIAELRRTGIVASVMYPEPISSIPAVQKHLADQGMGESADCRGARYVADHLFTLPTHPYLTTTDISRMVSALKAIKSA
jgi:perosamine synthetase